MEYVTMFFSHILKTIEYFAIEGFPEITPDMIPEVVQALIYDFGKIASMYLSLLFI